MKHKIGDPVRIVANNSGHQFEMGSVVTICDIHTNSSYTAIRRDGMEFCFDDEECEAENTVLVTPPAFQYHTIEMPEMTYRQWLIGMVLSGNKIDAAYSDEENAKELIMYADEIIKQLKDG